MKLMWQQGIVLSFLFFRGLFCFGEGSDPYARFRVPNRTPDGTPRRIVAIGDMHGDLEAALGALIAAKALNQNGQWIGKDLVLLSTGDYLDRGDRDLTLVDILGVLKEEVKKLDPNSVFVEINGNHEYANLMHDFSMVSRQSAHEYDVEFFKESQSWPHNLLSYILLGNVVRYLHLNTGRTDNAARALAFSPQGSQFERFSARQFFSIVGSTVFVHGGIREASLDYGLERIQNEVDTWLDDARSLDPLAWVYNQNSSRLGMPISLENSESPIWSRVFAQLPADPTSSGDSHGSQGHPRSILCEELGRVLGRMGVKRMVVGHTVQANGQITSACQQKIWRIDVGLSKVMWPSGGAPRDYQVLEIQGDQVRVLSTPRWNSTR